MRLISQDKVSAVPCSIDVPCHPSFNIRPHVLDEQQFGKPFDGGSQGESKIGPATRVTCEGCAVVEQPLHVATAARESFHQSLASLRAKAVPALTPLPVEQQSPIPCKPEVAKSCPGYEVLGLTFNIRVPLSLPSPASSYPLVFAPELCIPLFDTFLHSIRHDHQSSAQNEQGQRPRDVSRASIVSIRSLCVHHINQL